MQSIPIYEQRLQRLMHIRCSGLLLEQTIDTVDKLVRRRMIHLTDMLDATARWESMLRVMQKVNR